MMGIKKLCSDVFWELGLIHTTLELQARAKTISLKERKKEPMRERKGLGKGLSEILERMEEEVV